MDAAIVPKDLLDLLNDPHAQQARVRYCAEVSDALDQCGRALWAFGLAADQPAREAVALVTQTAGVLARGAVHLYSAEHWYAGAALTRQFIEAEYLLFLFAQDIEEAIRWRNCPAAERRGYFTPNAMRKRSNGKFREQEYWAHCENGGHPTPCSGHLLPEHRSLLGSQILLWSDLAQHLERVWPSFGLAVDASGCGYIEIVHSARNKYPAQLRTFLDADAGHGWFEFKT